MTNEEQILKRLREVIESQTPNAGLLQTGTGITFWREQTFSLLAGLFERALDAATAHAFQQGAAQAYEEAVNLECVFGPEELTGNATQDVGFECGFEVAVETYREHIRALKDSLAPPQLLFLPETPVGVLPKPPDDYSST
jgi:hypothetical protein